jgi:hypothetical protein
MIGLDQMEDILLARGQEAVAAGVLSWCGQIGSEEDAGKAPKLPALSFLLRRATFGEPQLVGEVMQQEALVEWSFFASGENFRTPGKVSGRKGARGAYHAIEVLWEYFMGFEIDAGFPIQLGFLDLAALDQKAGRAVYEVGAQHRLTIVQSGYEQ